MKNCLIATFFFFTVISAFAQNEIDTKYLVNNWRAIEFGAELMPDADEFLMIFKFSVDGTITIGSSFSVSSAVYELRADNTIKVQAEGMDEIWEIKKLTEKEFIFHEAQTGLVKLVFTNEDLPAVVTQLEDYPNEKEIVQKPAEPYSIETNYKGTRKTAQQLVGVWEVIKIGEIAAPEGRSLDILFDKNGTVKMLSNSDEAINGKWSLSDDNRKINVSGDMNDEVWGIKILDKKQLTIVEKGAGEIVMKRKDVKKKK